MKYRSTPRSRIARKQFAEIWRIFSILFGLIVIAGVSYAALIYWITSKPPQSVYFNIVEAWERLGIFIFVGNLITLIIAGGISATIAMYLANKSAIPLYNLGELCEQIGDGQFDVLTVPHERGRFRKLSISFRMMVNKLYLRKVEQDECIAQINVRIHELRSGLNLTGMQRDVLNELESHIQHLEKIV
jgi:hypothetical protein